MVLKKDSLKKLPGQFKDTFFNMLHTLPITVACMTVATLTATRSFISAEMPLMYRSSSFWQSCSMPAIRNATAPVLLLLFTVYSGSIMHIRILI